MRKGKVCGSMERYLEPPFHANGECFWPDAGEPDWRAGNHWRETGENCGIGKGKPKLNLFTLTCMVKRMILMERIKGRAFV